MEYDDQGLNRRQASEKNGPIKKIALLRALGVISQDSKETTPSIPSEERTGSSK